MNSCREMLCIIDTNVMGTGLNLIAFIHCREWDGDGDVDRATVPTGFCPEGVWCFLTGANQHRNGKDRTVSCNDVSCVVILPAVAITPCVG